MNININKIGAEIIRKLQEEKKRQLIEKERDENISSKNIYKVIEEEEEVGRRENHKDMDADEIFIVLSFL